MTIFDEAAEVASQAVDSVYGENLQLVFMTGGRNKAAAPDPARPSVTRVGTYVGIRRHVRINPANTMGHDIYPDITAAHITASFDNAAIAGLDIRQNDQLVRLDRPGQPKFEIVAKPIPGPSRTRLILAELGA